MARNSSCTIYIEVDKVPYHGEAPEPASLGLISAGTYAEACLTRLKQTIPDAAFIGHVTEKEDIYTILE